MEYSTHAKDFLNNQKFMGNHIRVFYSNYECINLVDPNSYDPNDMIVIDEDLQRFKSNKMSINPPSQILHVSNLKKNACNYELLFQLFS